MHRNAALAGVSSLDLAARGLIASGHFPSGASMIDPEEKKTALDRIKEREAELKKRLVDPRVWEIDVGAFYPAQLGMLPVMVGPDGRLWAMNESKWRCVGAEPGHRGDLQ